MKVDFVSRHGLDVDSQFCKFVEHDLVPLLHFSEEEFWKKLALIISSFSSENDDLLNARKDFQTKINLWCKKNSKSYHNHNSYHAFLKKIGYLEPPVDIFQIETENVDPEIALIAAPQLVVPVSNSRFALNASNARWGSLFDALYGSNLIPDKNLTTEQNNYDPQRGQLVIDYALNFIDKVIPIKNASHSAVSYTHLTLPTSDLV